MSDLVHNIAAAVQTGSLSQSAADNITRWVSSSAYAAYHARIEEMIAAEDFETLEGLFWEVLQFGTGGRRGLMADLGTATINERTIAESADGLARYAIANKGGDALSAVVAHDTRNNSAEFARLSAQVFAGRGVKVFLFEDYRSTPELSFAVRHLNCDVGVVISASHNPPSDNGFKAYWSHGGQVLAPHDQGIIDCVYDSDEIPLADFEEAVRSGAIEIVGAEIDREYINAVCSLSLSQDRSASAVFTPLHGVGATAVWEVLQQAGFEGVRMFEPQAAPDGNFTNVPDQLPNPERPEVFQPAIEAADGADLILASDPDADRLGVAVRDAAGDYTTLTGNQVGALIVDDILAKRTDLSAEHYVIETMVTTPLIKSIAESAGVRVIDDLLVGFKYIGEKMDELGPERFVFGSEESLGYLAGEYARDKDAAIAALYVMELASDLKQQGKTLLDRLDELYVAHGYHLEGQKSEVCPGPTGAQQIRGLMEAFRTGPPTELAGVALSRVRDYQTHEIRTLPGNDKSTDLPQPSGNLLFFESAPDAAVRFSFAARPSGTEPKIKFYFFAKSAVASADALSKTKRQTGDVVEACKAALSDWIQSRLA